MTGQASKKSFQELAAALAPAEQDSLRNGQVVISGDAGEYIARVLVDASPSLVWEVLTDYANFHKFLPNVSASEVLETDDSRTVVEQTNNTQILLADIESTIQTENIERGQQRVDFTMTEGDLKEFRGYWQITPVNNAEQQDQTLIKQFVVADADLGLMDGTFHAVFRGALQTSLKAIQTEISRRQQQTD
ncbi:hypothetical protein C1752_03701 [Acaryochloris thomasi RCC1774]|uniref:Coenzyme Q-binding protein COQ10 START domain-containing protein n=1 Tax=Acaryochloris thomasi RCC1774 TaxID=1764569 RepID=A0A2W1JFI1_9CYAN|nr:SRPBCC family protein [Acaryochloris thomasi]PZD72473.1 hypothetical protein C1752_03701 [Acaryochloris thomasi RCC1774]